MAHAAPPTPNDNGIGSSMGEGVDVSVHEEADRGGEGDPLAAISFRPLREGDLAEIKALHE